MKSFSVNEIRAAGVGLSVFLLMSVALSVQAQTATPAAASASHATTRSTLDERQVPYEELKNRIGQRVIIRTTFHTTRSGVLDAYFINLLDITTDKDQGGFALTVPRDTIKSVSIILQPSDDPLIPTAGKPGAKKN
jgi:hypothetical protein